MQAWESTKCAACFRGENEPGFLAIIIIVGLERSRKGLLEAHHQLQITNQQLAQAVEQKDFIIMRASHELRTPLTTILGRTQLLSSRLEKAGTASANLADLLNYLKVVETCSHHLQALIDSLLHLSNARTERVVLPIHLCDLGQQTFDIVENQRLLSGRSIELVRPAGPIMVPIDTRRFPQVLENLLNNAIKYSPENSPISVQLSVDQSQVTLRVHNEGASLSPEQITHLFDPFYRTSEVEYSSIPGWGPGLAISKEIVEHYGGYIGAESSETSGITFFVVLPLDNDNC